MPKLLVIDDDNTTRVFLQRVLEGEGHTVFEAADGFKAAQIYRQNNIDVIILDLLMPERDGIDVLRDIRSTIPDTKTIVISGAANEFLDLLQELGADSTISKPINASDLIAQVNALLLVSEE